jgi:hypothetical protein
MLSHRIQVDQPVTRAWPVRRRTAYHLLVERQRAEQQAERAGVADAERHIGLLGSMYDELDVIASSYGTADRQTYLERATAVRELADELVAFAGRLE